MLFSYRLLLCNPQPEYTSLSADECRASSSLCSCGVSSFSLFPQESTCIQAAQCLIYVYYFIQKQQTYRKQPCKTNFVLISEFFRLLNGEFPYCFPFSRIHIILHIFVDRFLAFLIQDIGWPLLIGQLRYYQFLRK